MRTIESVVAVGWDSHRKFSQVTLRDAEARVVERRRIEHADRDAMRAVLAAWPAGTPVVLEASFGWDWISDELAAAGHEPQLARSTTMAAWRKTAGRAKSNRLDADLLSEAPFEKRSGWRVWLPPVKVRERRELLRHRIALLQIQTMLKNRIHALLHRAGVLHAFSDLFGVAGRRFLQLLAAGEDPRLRPAARETLLCELQLLDQVRWHVARATREFRRQVQASPAAELLRTLPGVSWILAYTLLAEIGEIDRFRSGRNLASYALLAPVADDSGDDDGGGAHASALSPPRRLDRKSDAEVGVHRGGAHRGALRCALPRDLQPPHGQRSLRPRSRLHRGGPPPGDDRGGDVATWAGVLADAAGAAGIATRPPLHGEQDGCVESSRNGPARTPCGSRGVAAAGREANGPPAPDVRIGRRRQRKEGRVARRDPPPRPA